MNNKTAEEIKISEKFHSMNQAKRKTNIDVSSISRCCKGKVKTAGGFIWKYEKECVNKGENNE